MACVTGQEVIDIMESCTLTSTQLVPYINSANRIITNVFVNDTNVSEALKIELEKWLTAHMVASIRYRATVREKVGEAEVAYATGIFGMGLDSTPYGQMVKLLDPTGKLALAGKKNATIYAVKSFDI